MMSAVKRRDLWGIAKEEFDRAEPVRLILPVWLQNVLAISSQDRQISQFSGFLCSKLAVQGRYNMGAFSSVLTGSLQGIAERPLPCNYNVIQFVCALSRRCHRRNDPSKIRMLSAQGAVSFLFPLQCWFRGWPNPTAPESRTACSTPRRL